MNNEIQSQQQKQKPAQGASSKAGRGKPKGIPRGVWKEIPLNKSRRWEKNGRTTEAGAENASALEASLQSQGLLQNLVVIEAEDGFHDVAAAGGRRVETGYRTPTTGDTPSLGSISFSFQILRKIAV
jgi:ParB family chromosome partitioning protein